VNKRPLTIAFDYYDHVSDLASGRVPVNGVDLTCIQLHPPSQIFYRFLHFREFDASEVSFAKYVSMRASGDDSLQAIPVFTSRVPRHSAIYVRRDGPVHEPVDLGGKRVGIPEWAQTAGVYVRGLLTSAYGVDLRTIDWVQAGIDNAGRAEHANLQLPEGITLRTAPDRNLGEMLVSGEVDAVIAASPPRCFRDGHPNVRRLFEDFADAERAYVVRTGIFPIMHVIAIQSHVLESDPWIAMNLFDAFEEAKRLSLIRARSIGSLFPIPWSYDAVRKAEEIFGSDFWPYGLEENRPTLDAFLQYAAEQGVCARRLTPDELFPPQVRSRSKR
jgi:4,5-dihydroxyphthalate decarboxylase